MAQEIFVWTFTPRVPTRQRFPDHLPFGQQTTIRFVEFRILTRNERDAHFLAGKPAAFSL